MPFISFKITNKGNTKRNIIDILEKGVKGIIHINNNANYYVILEDNSKLDIYYKSFNCKDKEKIYQRITPSIHRVCIYRKLPYQKCETNHLFYIPFSVGFVAEGDIIMDNILHKKMFNIKRAYNEHGNIKCKEAFNYYKNNKEIIDKALLKQRTNNGI